MSFTSLPDSGEFRLGSVTLSGRRVRAYKGTGEPVAWITDELVPDPGRTWRLISGLAAGTGLQPLLCVPPALHQEEWRPEDYFAVPCDIDEIGRLDAGEILRREWEGRAVVETAQEDFALPGSMAGPAELYAPFSRQFPGLAPPTGGQLTEEEISRALDSLPPARVCLVAVSRPADILAAVGWEMTAAWDSMLPVSAVLRSWEDRFGARLVLTGPSAEIRLLVGRPARTLAAAQAIAAELWAFADAWKDYRERRYAQVNDVSRIIPRVLDSSIWGLWWD